LVSDVKIMKIRKTQTRDYWLAKQFNLKFLMLIEGGEIPDLLLLWFSKLLKTDSINLNVKVVRIRFINFLINKYK